LQFLLRVSGLIDALNERIGKLVYWAILASVIVSTVNASLRYSINVASNAWLELQWYLFDAVFLLCSGYALLKNEHIRIDIVAGRFSRRTQTWIDIIGTVFFLLPMAVTIMWLSWPVFVDSWIEQESSSNAGGLIRWPVKLLIPIGFFLLSIQGISELIKRIAFLRGLIPDPAAKQHSHGAPPPEVEAGV
jgi:TRAP-type mannitol/chloroaromatic compound transport system permease small subunit